MICLRSIIRNFSKGEFILCGASVCMTVLSFLIFDRTNYLMLTESLIGVTSLILNAKGNPIGQLLTVLFSVLYGIISFSFSYYGEMITYLGTTAPMAVISVIVCFIMFLLNDIYGYINWRKISKRQQYLI